MNPYAKILSLLVELPAEEQGYGDAWADHVGDFFAPPWPRGSGRFLTTHRHITYWSNQ